MNIIIGMNFFLLLIVLSLIALLRVYLFSINSLSFVHLHFQEKNHTVKHTVKFWIKLGFISFGGPAGQVAIMHEYLVEQKKWISDSKFLHALNYTMILPGPEAQQLATYTGWLLHGTKGGLVAGLFFILPSMFILMGLHCNKRGVLLRNGENQVIGAIGTSIKPTI